MVTRVHSGFLAPPRATLRPYALATLLFLLSLGLRLLLLPGDTRLPFFTFYPAVALAFYLIVRGAPPGGVGVGPKRDLSPDAPPAPPITVGGPSGGGQRLR